MFSLINFIKSVLLDEAPTVSRTVLETAPFINCEAKPAATAIVTQAIVPGRAGQVKFQGSWWTARCDSGATLLAGDMVQVIHRQSLTLYVEPLPLFTMPLRQTALLPS